MPKKPGNGGHGPEEYDVNTGKYVADGQPNKYYDNPDEKITASVSHNLSDSMRDKLVDVFGDIFGETEFDDEINKMFEKPKIEKYTKPVQEMSQEELLTEIGEHKGWLNTHNISLEMKCFDLDLKLKCANFREMHRLFEKYPFFENLKHKIRFRDEELNNAAAITHVFRVDENYDKGIFTDSEFFPCDGISFNPKFFKNFYYVNFSMKNDIQRKYCQDAKESELSHYVLTHEFGHLLASRFVYEMLEDDTKQLEGRKIYSSKESFSTVLTCYTKTEYFHTQTRNDVINILKNQNPSLTEQEIIEDISEYGQTNNAEWFAETFASLECGKPTKLALAFKEWLEGKIEIERRKLINARNF